MGITKILHTTGMHCKSCEIMLRDAIEEIEGCKVQSISSKTGIVSVDMRDESDEERIREVIRSNGYYLVDETNIEAKRNGGFNKILWLFFAGFLLFIFFRLDISRLLPTYEKL